MERQKAEVVQLEPDIDRVIAALAFVIDAAERMGGSFTQYDVVKSLFLADRAHLNDFGRLISSDRYVAMEHGPVPSTAYNVLKQDIYTMQKYALGQLPWQTAKGDGGKLYFHDASLDAVDEYLSPSDMAAIEAAVATIKSLSFGQIRKLTHDDPAYVDAWEEDPNCKSFPMSLGMLFEAPNFERARELSEMSKLK